MPRFYLKLIAFCVVFLSWHFSVAVAAKIPPKSSGIQPLCEQLLRSRSELHIAGGMLTAAFNPEFFPKYLRRATTPLSRAALSAFGLEHLTYAQWKELLIDINKHDTKNGPVYSYSLHTREGVLDENHFLSGRLYIWKRSFGQKRSWLKVFREAVWAPKPLETEMEFENSEIGFVDQIPGTDIRRYFSVQYDFFAGFYLTLGIDVPCADLDKYNYFIEKNEVQINRKTKLCRVPILESDIMFDPGYPSQDDNT